MTEIDSYITSDDANFLSSLLLQATQEELVNSTAITWSVLYNSASNFLRGYSLLDQQENFERKKILQSLIQAGENNNFLFEFQQKHGDAYFKRAKYLLAFDFDRTLTQYLGEVPKEAIYVIWDSKTKKVKSFKMSMAQLAQFATAEGRLFLTAAQLKKEAEQLEKQDTYAGIEKQHLMEAQAAYRGTVARLGQFYNKANISWTQRKNGLLMWKQSGYWVIANVNSYGDVKEGYVAALMTKHQMNLDALFNKNIGIPKYYDDLLISSFYNNYITGVTNKAAIVEEDVKTEFGQYAVKSSGASMPSMQQYLNVAKQIISYTSEISPKMLKEKIVELYPQDAQRNKIITTVNNLGELTTNELLSNIQKQGLQQS